MRKFKLLSFVILVVASLSAQDNNSFRFGTGFTAVFPVGGDFSKIVSAGFGPSMFVEKPLTENLMILGEANYIIYDKKNPYGVDVNEWNTSLDAVWYFDGRKNGPFAFVTTGLKNRTYKWGDGPSFDSRSTSSLDYGAGFGYAIFSRFTIECRYTLSHPFDNNFQNPLPFFQRTASQSNSAPLPKPIQLQGFRR